jgi:uroporphyrinogen decarboxylase
LAMNSRELVYNTVTFKGAERMPYDLPPQFGSDFAEINMSPSPDARPSSGVDEWGALWKNLGTTRLGEVKEYPLKDWRTFDSLDIPDITDPLRWAGVQEACAQAGDNFILAYGISIYERVHFIRGLENTWMDIYDHPAELCRLLDLLVEMNITAIERYAAAGADGFFLLDDWGLQSSLMIAPQAWREFWKPRYARIFKAAHDAGMLTFLHSCGYIIAILNDLIEAGLDVIQMDQQENMGLENLSAGYAGRITFFCPVDIQATMVYGTMDEIRDYCRKMVALLGRPNGGFIPRWYADPAGAGHRPEAIKAMSEEFMRLAYWVKR